jgi:hypothetical protein
MISYSDALETAQQMYLDAGYKDLELGAAAVLRDLHKIANNTSIPLVQVEAIGILFALAEGPDNDTSWIPQNVRDMAKKFIQDSTGEV